MGASYICCFGCTSVGMLWLGFLFMSADWRRSVWWYEPGTDSTAKALRLLQRETCVWHTDGCSWVWASPMALVILTVHVPITAVWVISPSTLLSLWVAGRECLSLDMALGLHLKDWLDWSEIIFIWTACARTNVRCWSCKDGFLQSEWFYKGSDPWTWWFRVSVYMAFIWWLYVMISLLNI